MKTYLVAVCGWSPQVITETLYALHQQGVTVDAIRILTTRGGKDACIGQLLRAEDGEYYRYLEEYGHDPAIIDFSARHIIAVLHEDGTEIQEIDTEEENERFLQLCMEQTFALTSQPDTRVLFSIAGGRRTMGTCLSLAAQCYARPQDRIYQVLLTPAMFESCRDFFYPPKEARLVEVRTHDGLPCQVSTDEAQVVLVPLPFFPLRGHLTTRMLQHPETPSSLMLSLIRETRHELTIDLVQRKLVWKDVELDMGAAKLALYAFLSQVKKEAKCTRSSCQECEACYLSFEQISERQAELTRIYQRMTTRELGDSGIVNLEATEFNSYRSKINREIAFRFGEYESRKLKIESHGQRLALKFGIRLNKKRIRIIF